jgi:hypothetical protein
MLTTSTAKQLKGQKYEYCYSLWKQATWELRKLDLATGQFQDSAATSSFGPTCDPRYPWRVVDAV